MSNTPGESDSNARPQGDAPRPDGPEKTSPQAVIIPHEPVWHQKAVAWLVALVLRAVSWSLRFRWDDQSGLLKTQRNGPVIFCMWHNRLGLAMEAVRIYKRHRRGPGMAALVSASKDGALLAAILKNFKVQAVRGSSSRRGRQALLELTTWIERGYDVAITPDGPRGPCYVIQNGVMSLAQVTGLPIIAVSYHSDWKIRVKSWDRFQIPVPFSRCLIISAPPLRVPREATDAEREALRKQLEDTMKALTPD